jgi:hypothetical protein
MKIRGYCPNSNTFAGRDRKTEEAEIPKVLKGERKAPGRAYKLQSRVFEAVSDDL